jgi:hypothetical protein
MVASKPCRLGCKKVMMRLIAKVNSVNNAPVFRSNLEEYLAFSFASPVELARLFNWGAGRFASLPISFACPARPVKIFEEKERSGFNWGPPCSSGRWYRAKFLTSLPFGMPAL